MIVSSLDIDPTELERRTGWVIKPEGACKGERCVPLGGAGTADGGRVDGRLLAERLGMALVQDQARGLWALGPEAGGRALASAELPEIVLPDRDGQPFAVRSLRGSKIFLLAWASW
jgi:hypothetical protein